MQIFYLALRWSYRNRLPFQASALTFMTLLSLVPALAISFSLAKGLGYADQLERFLVSSEYTASQAEVFQQLIGYVQRTQVGTLGVVGMVVLLATLVVTLSSVEETFNLVWEVRVQRGWMRRFSDYLSVLVVLPLVVLATTTIWAAVPYLELVQWFRGLDVVGPVASWGMGLGPLVILTAAFVFIYLFLPNTSMPFWSAALGGMIAAGLWWEVQRFYLYSQIGVARYNAIYGGFAMLPLFFVWVQVSWMVLLFGNELARAHYLCCKGIRPQAALPRLREAQREALALRLMLLVALHFHNGEQPASLAELAAKLNAPLLEVRRLAGDLAEAELLTHPDLQERVQPARSLASLKISYLLAALRGENCEEVSLAVSGGPGPGEEILTDLLRRSREARRKAVGDLTLLDLVGYAQARPSGRCT
jgi:membrane protein